MFIVNLDAWSKMFLRKSVRLLRETPAIVSHMSAGNSHRLFDILLASNLVTLLVSPCWTRDRFADTPLLFGCSGVFELDKCKKLCQNLAS